MLEWTESCHKLVTAHEVDSLLFFTQISKVSSAYWCLKHALEFGISCTSNVHIQALHQDKHLLVYCQAFQLMMLIPFIVSPILLTPAAQPCLPRIFFSERIVAEMLYVSFMLFVTLLYYIGDEGLFLSF